MSLNVGELFVNLGVKGNDKTVGALQGVVKGLGEAKTMSLEAKAGILGAMYALERLFAASGHAGTALTNFNALTGLSTKQLQQWQYAAIQAGSSSQEMTGTVMAMQKAMAGVDLAKGVPEGLILLSQAAGGIDFRKKDDPFYMLESIQKGLKALGNSPRSKAIENYLASSMGISPGVIAGMQRGLFNKDVFKRAPTYSDSEISQLDRANIAWANLGQKIEMSVGKFNARHGGQLVKDLAMITDSVLHLAEALEKVSTQFGLFTSLGHGLEGVANTLKVVSEISDKLQGKESKKGDLLHSGKELVPGFSSSPVGQFFQDLLGGNAAPAPVAQRSLPLPYGGSDLARPSVRGGHGATKEQTINVNQHLNFQHDGKDHKKTGDSVKKANQDAFRQFNQGQAS